MIAAAMAQRFDVIVIGVGGMGSAACFHLARRGARVLGIERFNIPHDRGSSHGFSRMIRMAYYEHADYVPLLRRAWKLWEDLENETGQKILHATGGVYIGPRGSAFVERSRESAEQHGLPHQMLDATQLAAKCPQFFVPADYVALHETFAGLVIPERAISAHVDLAMKFGAEIHGNEQVLDWSEDVGGVTVRTDRGSYAADQLIVCGGAWSDRVVRDLGVALVVTRQVLGWVQPKRPRMFELGSMPVWAIDHLDGTIHYGFPMLPDNPGVKVAHHWRGPRVDPDTIARDPQPGDEADFRGVLSRFIPEADGPLLSIRTCLYTNSPDGHFIIDRLPGHARVTVACGFSGHGFKFATVVGEALAELAMQGRSELPIGFLSFGRFG
jgi:sarcosine oxidase